MIATCWESFQGISFDMRENLVDGQSTRREKRTRRVFMEIQLTVHHHHKWLSHQHSVLASGEMHKQRREFSLINNRQHGRCNSLRGCLVHIRNGKLCFDAITKRRFKHPKNMSFSFCTSRRPTMFRQHRLLFDSRFLIQF